MTSSVLEQIRSCHEDLERYERVATDLIKTKSKTQIEYITQQHKINYYLGRMKETNEQLKRLYQEKDSLLKKEEGESTTATRMFAFIKQLEEIRTFHQASGTASTLVTSTVEDVDLNELVTFTGDEAFGRLFDLNASHGEFVNLPFVNQLQLNGSFEVFLNTIKQLHMIPREMKANKEYEQFLYNLLEYLKSFFVRVSPLEDFDQIEEDAMEYFGVLWRKGSWKGWDKVDVEIDEMIQGEAEPEEMNEEGMDISSSTLPEKKDMKKMLCRVCGQTVKANLFGFHRNGKKHRTNELKLRLMMDVSKDVEYVLKQMNNETSENSDSEKKKAETDKPVSSKQGKGQKASEAEKEQQFASTFAALLRNIGWMEFMIFLFISPESQTFIDSAGNSSAPSEGASSSEKPSSLLMSLVFPLLGSEMNRTEVFVAKKRLNRLEEHRADMDAQADAAVERRRRRKKVAHEGEEDEDDEDIFDDFGAESDDERERRKAKEKEEEEDFDDDEGSVPYNPKGVPLGWDGKPIPLWLYKLNGLNQEFKCEICGNAVYKGPKNFEKHFQEWRHAHGMRSLKIPNTLHFHGITKISEAVALYEKMKKEVMNWSFVGSEEEEFEDAYGNVHKKKVYDDLKRQGLL